MGEANSRSIKVHPFEFEVERMLNVLAPAETWNERWLIAVSGGQDSISLLHVLTQLQSRLGLELGVAHVHHGPDKNEDLTSARDRAAELVKKSAEACRLPFFDLGYSTLGRSQILPTGAGEEQLRDFRHAVLETELRTGAWDRVAFAHHRQDLVETRMIRLIRGTGPEGLKAMRPLSEGRVYPFLKQDRDQIDAYAKAKGLIWYEDPSNQSREPLRNWLRLEWLTALDGKRPGGVAALGRSLDLIVEAFEENHGTRAKLFADCCQEASLDRVIYEQLRPTDQRFILASYLRTVGARGFGSSHLEEIMKRLDTPQRNYTFVVAKHRWTVNAEQIRAEALKPHC